MLTYADRYLPQQPLLPCLLPSAKTYNTLRTTTNPYEVTLSVKAPAAAAGGGGGGKGKAAASAAPGVVVLGTSGQNVEDILKYSSLDGSLDILERLLEWRHLAPTGVVRHRNTLVA
jgi:DNA polymerase delta subunit 2